MNKGTRLIMAAAIMAATVCSCGVTRGTVSDGWTLVWEDNFDQKHSFDTATWSRIDRGTSDWNRHMSHHDACYAMRKGNLVLRGFVGRGKTHLSAAIANACIERGLTVVYRRTDDLLDLIRVSKFERGQDSDETIRTFDLLRNCDLLILDDFGAEARTEFAIDELTRLIEDRNLRNKSWVLNTNLEYGDIEKLYDPRLMDRIDEKATVFRLEMPESFRREEARKDLDVELI